jgi:hypothetical protein
MRKTITWFALPLPVIADLRDGRALVAHPGGPALCNGDIIATIDGRVSDPPERARLSHEARVAFREWAWPQLAGQFEFKL